MKAFVVQNGTYQQKMMEEKEPKKGEVLVQLKTAGLNHRDLLIKNRVNKNDPAYILGSDGAGVIEKTGEEVTRFKGGEEVIINPSLNWYEKSADPPEDFQIAGVPSDGTLAEKIVIPEDFVEERPVHLSWEEAGVFALAALTGYRALFTQGQLQDGETVFIPGVGSGVNSFMIQMAKAIGTKVITTSRSEEKLKRAEVLGYDIGLKTDDNWTNELAGETIDLVIESVGGATFNRSLDILKRGGRLVTFGSSTEDTFSFNLRKFFYGQYKLIGSTMGSREELREVIQFAEQYDIKPIIDKGFSFDQVETAFDYLASQKQLGKVYISF